MQVGACTHAYYFRTLNDSFKNNAHTKNDEQYFNLAGKEQLSFLLGQKRGYFGQEVKSDSD